MTSADQTPIKVRRRYIDGPFGQIHLRECGVGDPVLLLHQSPVSSLMFEPALPYLAKAGFRAIAFDTPGYGMSDPPPASPTIGSYALAVTAVMDALQLDSTHLVGSHTGAAIAACFAVANSHRVQSLVLNGVPLLSDDDKGRMLAMDLRPPRPKPDGSHLLNTWNTRILLTPGWTDLDWMHRFLVEGLVAGENADWATRAVLTYDAAADLRRITVRTLFFTSAGDNLLDATRKASEMRPDLECLTLENGTQDVPVEQPEAWSQAVTGFLRRNAVADAYL